MKEGIAEQKELQKYLKNAKKLNMFLNPRQKRELANDSLAVQQSSKGGLHQNPYQKESGSMISSVGSLNSQRQSAPALPGELTKPKPNTAGCLAPKDAYAYDERLHTIHSREDRHVERTPAFSNITSINLDLIDIQVRQGNEDGDGRTSFDPKFTQ